MPPARHKVWEQRKPAPMAIVASDEDVEKVTVDTLGDSSWDKLWRNTNGKIKLFICSSPASKHTSRPGLVLIMRTVCSGL